MNDTSDDQNKPKPPPSTGGGTSTQPVPNLDALMGSSVSSWNPQEKQTSHHANPAPADSSPEPAAPAADTASSVPDDGSTHQEKAPPPQPPVSAAPASSDADMQSSDDMPHPPGPGKDDRRRTLVGLVVLLLLVISVPTGMFFVSQRNQIADIRQQAAGEVAHLTLSPQTDTVATNQPFTVQLRVDANTPIDGVQAKINVTGSADITAQHIQVAGLSSPPPVLTVENGVITFLTITSSPSIPFSPSGNVALLDITVTPHESVTLTFDDTFSKITATGDPADILVTPANGVYTLSGGNTPTPTPVGSTNTPSPTQIPQTNQCQDIHVYKDGQLVTDWGSLEPGDTVEFGVVPQAGSTSGRLSINGGTFTESIDTNSSGEYAFQYTFPTSGTANFTIQSQVQINGVWR